ncbi:MAG: penicillin acylase family protein [Chloroflexi bacterium]|nr:penicillin acylase family protein [Chloroflexota bacterium]
MTTEVGTSATTRGNRERRDTGASGGRGNSSGDGSRDTNGRARAGEAARTFAIAALQGDRPLAEVAAAHGVSTATARRRVREYLTRTLPQTSGQFNAAVARPVEIVRDRHGIPHVFAQSEEDAYVGLGFVVGQDRLWQLEYRRRWAYGTLAEVLGPAGLASDTTARTLRFDRIAEAEQSSQSPETRRLLEAYAHGVNAAIDAFGDDLPPEFDVLGIPMAPWRAVDTVTIARASLWQFSGRIETIVIGEVAQRLLPPDLAARFLSVEAPYETIVPSSDGARDAHGRGQGAPDGSKEPQGSNQWCVGPGMSSSGAPLLASDGHVPYYQPSTRYEVHLVGGSLDVIGIADVGMPLVHNGRTRGAAWGLTNNVSSVRDLYAEEPNPANPNEVRDGDGWTTLERREETIRVRGAEPVTLTVRTGPHGPIVNHLIPGIDPTGGDPPLALRWVGLEPRDSIGAGFALSRAQTAYEVRATHRDWHFSGQNPGFADSQGHIGFQMRIRFPVRGRATRGFRSPTNPADAWHDPLPFEVLPAEADPPRGWTASANQRPHPIGSDLPLYGAYGDGYRGRRIRAWLEGTGPFTPGRKGPFTLDDMGAMQNDVYSERVAEVKRALAGLLADAPSNSQSSERSASMRDASRSTPSSECDDFAWASRVIRRWDSRYTVGSIGASLFAAFWWRWCRRIAAARFPAHLVEQMAGAANAVAHDLLLEPDVPWFASATRGEARAAMAEALTWLAEKLGADRRRWTWGRLHPLTLTHALSAGRPAFAEFFDLGPRPCPGGGSVLNQNGYVVRDRFATTSGPHYRFLADLAEPAQARGVNTAGNAGNPASPHYGDQLDDWLAGRYHPLWMDRADVEVNAEATLRLEPEG